MDSKRKDGGGNKSLKGEEGAQEIRRSGEGGTWRSQAGRQKGEHSGKGCPVGEERQGEDGKGGGSRGFARRHGPLPPAGGASSPVLTARDPLKPQHVLRPDRLPPLQRPWPGPRACLRFRLGPGFGFRLRLRLRLWFHAQARGPRSGLRPRPGPAAALLHLHGLAGPRLACCRRAACAGCSPERGASAAPPPAGPRYRPAPPLRCARP